MQIIDAQALCESRLKANAESVFSLGDFGPLYDWLMSNPCVEDRHHVALYGNWDFADVSLFHFIATRPDCDLATALRIFHAAQPSFYAERGLTGQELVMGGLATVMMLTDIRQRFHDGFYKSRIYSFELDEYDRADLTRLRSTLHWFDSFVPKEMEVSVSGVDLEHRSDWIEGFPPIIQEIDQ